MAVGNRNDTVTIVLVLCLIFATLASSTGFVRNITQESGSENRSSGDWTAVSGGRPVRSDPNTFHHHKSRTENGGASSSSRVAVPTPRPVRSGPNPYQHNRHDYRTASQP
ncbi:uncharacterized protein LOC127900412 [Citrus sinensis]|uniref:uncharacterized protein LOC127900412 n=1 Tax=Citrus sinensis TaxID=2711 RepID=UPI0022780BEB|nr:uncharacterized protein LOC127900412 [Citrus sinensis]